MNWLPLAKQAEERAKDASAERHRATGNTVEEQESPNPSKKERKKCLENQCENAGLRLS